MLKRAKTWWLGRWRAALSTGPAALVLFLVLTLAFRSIWSMARHNNDFVPHMFSSLDTRAFSISEDTFMRTHTAPLQATGDNASAPAAIPTGCLAMIIKNEGPILPRLFESVRGFASEYCVVDTGSTDDTIDILKSMNMPGVVLEEPFVDFATTRNYMIDACRRVMTSCDYMVLLDADMVLRVSPEWDWAKLDRRDVYNFIQVSSIEYENVRMIRRDATDIRVVGATHEYYAVPAEYTTGTLPKGLVHIQDVGDGKAKGDKFERDERLLRRELEHDPDNPRTVFYLANTLKDRRKYAEAILYYERRASMRGWFAEADYSLFMLSTCYLALGDLDNARKYGELAAWSGAAKRAEPLYFLAFHYRQQGHYKMAWYYATLAAKIPKPDVSTALFISYAIYDYWLDHELATLCRQVFPTQLMQGIRASLAFWNNVHAPEYLRHSFAAVMKAYVGPMIDETSTPSHEVFRASCGTATPLARFVPNTGQVQLLVHKEVGEMDAHVEFQVLDVGVPNKGGHDTGAPWTWQVESPPAHASTHIAWQFVGPHGVIGFPNAEPHVLYHGEWNEHDASSRKAVHMRRVSVSDQVPQQRPVWSLVDKAGTVHCVSKWYPAIEVGIFDASSSEASCRVHTSHPHVPRAFSFFGASAHGLVYRDDVWFVLRVETLSAFVLVILGPDFGVKAFTAPFIMEDSNGVKKDTTFIGFKIATGEDGQDHLVYVYTSGKDAIVKQVLVDDVLARIV